MASGLNIIPVTDIPNKSLDYSLRRYFSECNNIDLLIAVVVAEAVVIKRATFNNYNLKLTT